MQKNWHFGFVLKQKLIDYLFCHVACTGAHTDAVILTYLDRRYQQNRVDHDEFVVFLTRVILKSQGASENLCSKTDTRQ